MKKFLYSGPPSGVTLDDGKEVLLYPGKIKDLPENNEFVMGLVDQRLLQEVPAPAKKAAPAKGDKASDS